MFRKQKFFLTKRFSKNWQKFLYIPILQATHIFKNNFTQKNQISKKSNLTNSFIQSRKRFINQYNGTKSLRADANFQPNAVEKKVHAE